MSESNDQHRKEPQAPPSSGEAAPPLGDVPVNERGAAGVFYVLSWGIANLAITFLASLVLARLLSPVEFGVFAIGQTVVMLASTISEGGIASGFVRRSEGITKEVLRSINGMQLLIALILAIAVTAIAPRFGLGGELAALIVWALPISSIQTAGRVLLARELRFREVTFIEAFGTFAYYSWAIAGVVLGYGVWSLASAVLIRAAVGVLMMGRTVGWGLIVPSLGRLRDVLDVIGFGIRFSVSGLLDVIYEQVRNIIIAAIGGAYALGLWALVTRILQVPNLVYQPLHQVAFPAFSQLIASGRDPSRSLERVTRLSLSAGTLILPAFFVSVPTMIPILFGSQWEDAAKIFPGIMLSIFIGQSIASPCIHFLFALGRPSAVVRAKIIGLSINIACIALLLWLIGLPGIGIGTIPGAAFESIVLGRIVQRSAGANVFVSIPIFFAASATAVGGGFIVLWAISDDIFAALLAAVVAAGTAMIVCFATQREVVMDLLSVGRTSVSSALAGSRG